MEIIILVRQAVVYFYSLFFSKWKSNFMQSRSLSLDLYSVHMQYCLFLYWISVIMITHYSAGGCRCFHEMYSAVYLHVLCRDSNPNIMHAHVNSTKCVRVSMHKVLNFLCWILWWVPVFPLMQYISKAQVIFEVTIVLWAQEQWVIYMSWIAMLCVFLQNEAALRPDS